MPVSSASYTSYPSESGVSTYIYQVDGNHEDLGRIVENAVKNDDYVTIRQLRESSGVIYTSAIFDLCAQYGAINTTYYLWSTQSKSELAAETMYRRALANAPDNIRTDGLQFWAPTGKRNVTSASPPPVADRIHAIPEGVFVTAFRCRQDAYVKFLKGLGVPCSDVTRFALSQDQSMSGYDSAVSKYIKERCRPTPNYMKKFEQTWKA